MCILGTHTRPESVLPLHPPGHLAPLGWGPTGPREPWPWAAHSPGRHRVSSWLKGAVLAGHSDPLHVICSDSQIRPKDGDTNAPTQGACLGLDLKIGRARLTRQLGRAGAVQAGRDRLPLPCSPAPRWEARGAHPGDDRRRALGGGVAAQGLVHAPALPAAPHALVGGVGGQAQAAVAAAKGAVVEGHCGRRSQWSPAPPRGPPLPRPPAPASPTSELAVDVLVIGLDEQMQGQRLVAIMGQLGAHPGTCCTPCSHPRPRGPPLWPLSPLCPVVAEGQQGRLDPQTAPHRSGSRAQDKRHPGATPA